MLSSIRTGISNTLSSRTRRSSRQEVIDHRIRPEEVRLGKKIGEGGFGEVYIATFAKRQVVAKKVKIEAMGEAAALRGLEDELSVAVKLRNPCVVQIFGAVITADTIMLIMEYCGNGSLRAKLDERPRCTLTRDQRVAILGEAAEGLKYLTQRGIIHRDVKVSAPKKLIVLVSLAHRLCLVGSCASVLYALGLPCLRLTTCCSTAGSMPSWPISASAPTSRQRLVTKTSPAPSRSWRLSCSRRRTARQWPTLRRATCMPTAASPLRCSEVGAPDANERHERASAASPARSHPRVHCLRRAAGGGPWQGHAQTAAEVIARVQQGQMPPLPPNLPVELAALVKACLAPDRTARPTFDKIVAALDSFDSASSKWDPTAATEEEQLELARQMLINLLQQTMLEEAEASQPLWPGAAFQKGDHVRVVGTSLGAGHVKLGDVGVVQGRSEDHSHFTIDFIAQDGWAAKASDLALDLTAQRVRPGARCALRPSVSEPRFGMGNLQPGMVGLCHTVSHDGIAKINFGFNGAAGKADDGLWAAPLSELMAVTEGGTWLGGLQCGHAVRIRRGLEAPSTGWGAVTAKSVGYVRAWMMVAQSIYYVVDFPEMDGCVQPALRSGLRWALALTRAPLTLRAAGRARRATWRLIRPPT